MLNFPYAAIFVHPLLLPYYEKLLVLTLFVIAPGKYNGGSEVLYAFASELSPLDHLCFLFLRIHGAGFYLHILASISI